MARRKDLTRLVKDYVVKSNTAIDISFTVEEALDCLKHRHIDDKIIYIYVVDKENHLIGYVPVRSLIFSDAKAKIADVMQTSVICLKGSQTLQEAMQFLESHKLLALPVIDNEKKLLGIIDVSLYLEESMDVMNADRREDIFQMIGMYLEEDKKIGIFKSYCRRMPWIFCNMFAGIACAVISKYYTQVLSRFLLLAMFIPLVLTLSESISMQTMTQSLEMTRGKNKLHAVFGKLFKRSVIVAMIAITSGVLIGAVSLFWGDGILAGVVIGVGIMVSVYVSAAFGSIVPLLLHALRLDPKIASGPVVLMIADMLTTAFYLALATALLI